MLMNDDGSTRPGVLGPGLIDGPSRCGCGGVGGGRQPPAGLLPGKAGRTVTAELQISEHGSIYFCN